MTIEALRHDVHHAVRSMARYPGHAIVAILILALGIGANTAVFSVVNPLLLRPLPFRDADRLVWIANTGTTGLSGRTHRVAVYEEMARGNRSFESLTAYFAFFGYGSYVLSGRGEPERLVGVDVAPRFLELLGIRPSIGRDFVQDEWQTNGPRAAILTLATWQQRFGGDPAVVGRAVTINDEPYTIAGVLPADFDFSSTFTPGVHVDLLLPARLDDMRNWGNTLSIVGRLRPGVTLASARAEFDTLIPRIRELHKDWGRFGAVLTDLKTQIGGPMRRALVVLWCAVGLVLVIACANLSNLLLARTAGRSREFAVRMALGSSRGRLVQQLVTEGIVLAACGGALGVPLAYALTAALQGSSTLAVPLLHQVRVDTAALIFTAVAAIASGLMFGALPALRVAARPPQEALRSQGRGATDAKQHTRVRSALVVAEIALASVLLVGAGLLLRSFLNILDVDLGFQPAHAVALRLDVKSTVPEEQRLLRLEQAARRVAALPGVEAAGLTDALPLDRNRTWGLGVPGQVYGPGQRPTAFVYITGPGYLRAMGIPLRAGRDFTARDTARSEPVLIVNETLARILYPGQDAVGRPVQLNDASQTIVGVVHDVRQTNVDEAPASQMYLPYARGGGAGAELIVRSGVDASSMVASARTALAALDPMLAVTGVRPITDLVERAVSPRRFLVSLLGAFSGMGLLLASLGIYGVVSYGVTQRTREIGVRMALGATAAIVRREVLTDTLRLALAGVALGMTASALLARVLTTLLYGTSPGDPLTFAGTAALLVTVAAIAGFIPALRASRVDPMTALRME